MYTLNALLKFLFDFNHAIESLKVTKLDISDFNDMEGYQWYFNVKVLLVNGKSKLIKIHTNDTYMEDFISEIDKEITKELLTECLQDLI